MVWPLINGVHGQRMGMLPAVFILELFSTGTATSKNAASTSL